MSDDLKVGDAVSWRHSQGRTHGRVVDRRTKDFQHQGQHFTASDDEPMYLVESDRTGAMAAHRPEALRRE